MPDVLSNWKVTAGTGLVVVDHGQRMNGEIQTTWKQVVEESRRLEAEAMEHFPRGNVSGSLVIGAYKDHADDATAREWVAELQATLSSDFTEGSTTLEVVVAGGNTYTVSGVALEDAPTVVVLTAAGARTLTTWKFKTGSWTLSGTGGGDDDAVGLEAALLNVSGASGMLDAGGAAAEHLEEVETWQNDGTGADAEGAAGELPVLLGKTGLYLPGTSGNYVTLADEGNLDMTSSFAVRIECDLPSYRPAAAMCLASKWTEAGDQRSWRMMLTTTGTITLEISTDGTAGTITTHTSTTALPLGLWEPLRLGVSRSTTACSFILYPADRTAAGTLLGDSLTGLATLTPFNSTAPLNIGASEAGTANLLEGMVTRFDWWRTTATISFDSIVTGQLRFYETAISAATQVPYLFSSHPGPASIGRSGTDSARMVFAPVLRFDGSDDSVAMATPAALNAVAGVTLAWMGTLNTVTGTQDLVFCANNATGIRVLLRANGSTVELHVRRTDAEAVAVVSYAAAFTAYLPKVVIAVVDYASGIATIYLDGVAKASGTLTSAGVTSATDSTETRLMAGQAGANPARGELNHALILDEATPFAEVADLYTDLWTASR
jgi:hypothetical protein